MMKSSVADQSITEPDADPILAGLATEARLLTVDIEAWRSRMPARAGGRGSRHWLAEGQELLRRQQRIEVLARQYGLVDLES